MSRNWSYEDWATHYRVAAEASEPATGESYAVLRAEMFRAARALMTLPPARASVPGQACVHCDTVIGQPLECTGCGRVDPLTRRPQANLPIPEETP